jgi:hypothetical protein
VSAASSSLTHVTSVEEIAWGVVLIAATMTIHAVAMPTTLLASRRLRARRPSHDESFRDGVLVLLAASWMIVITHLLEVVVWAAFFYLRDAFPNVSAAYYFALLQYTTVGSDLTLPDRWRLLGGMIAMAGLLTFAWSTTVLLTLAQRVQDEGLHRMGPVPSANRSESSGDAAMRRHQ